MTNFADMLSKAKAMQDKMREAQEKIKKIEVEGVSGGNLVNRGPAYTELSLFARFFPHGSPLLHFRNAKSDVLLQICP